MKAKIVVSGFIAGKIQKNGNPIVTLTLKTAEITQTQLDKLGDTISNYGTLELAEKSGA